MGCCCDQDDDVEIMRHLNPSSATQSLSDQTPTADSSTSVLSPMNSHFSALSCRDILRLIFEKLSIPDLARSSSVCRLWHLVASDQEIIAGAFKAPWKVKDVVGKPCSGSFWRDNCLGKFAISHRILRGDSLASLAVKYSVQVMDIKRLNNMMSDHGIYSRERLLIPIGNPSILINSICYIEMDACAKREVAVLYLDGSPMTNNLYSKMTYEQGMTSGSVRGKKKIIHSLSRSMQVDGETAQYYLSISNGDPRAALTEFSEDIRWERHVGIA